LHDRALALWGSGISIRLTREPAAAARPGARFCTPPPLTSDDRAEPLLERSMVCAARYPPPRRPTAGTAKESTTRQSNCRRRPACTFARSHVALCSGPEQRWQPLGWRKRGRWRMSAVGHTPDSDPWQVSPCRSDAGAQRRFFALEAFWTPGLQVSTPDPSLGILFFLGCFYWKRKRPRSRRAARGGSLRSSVFNAPPSGAAVFVAGVFISICVRSAGESVAGQRDAVD